MSAVVLLLCLFQSLDEEARTGDSEIVEQRLTLALSLDIALDDAVSRDHGRNLKD